MSYDLSNVDSVRIEFEYKTNCYGSSSGGISFYRFPTSASHFDVFMEFNYQTPYNIWDSVILKKPINGGESCQVIMVDCYYRINHYVMGRNLHICFLMNSFFLSFLFI